MEAEEKRLQIADQCKVVAHLARALADISGDYEKMMRDDACAGGMDNIADIVGNRTARHMNVLGDILNGMDAATDEDEWTAPIFERAHTMFPQPTE